MKQDNKDLSFLIGKTIEKIEWVPIPCETASWKRPDACPYDDGDKLKLTFTDGSSIEILASYGAYTGNSEDEYPTFLSTYIKEPEGYNGPGMYETQTFQAKPNGRDEPLHYYLTFDGQEREIWTSILRFQAESLEHAKSLLNLNEVEYVKWIDFNPKLK